MYKSLFGIILRAVIIIYLCISATNFIHDFYTALNDSKSVINQNIYSIYYEIGEIF